MSAKKEARRRLAEARARAAEMRLLREEACLRGLIQKREEEAALRKRIKAKKLAKLIRKLASSATAAEASASAVLKGLVGAILVEDWTRRVNRL